MTPPPPPGTESLVPTSLPSPAQPTDLGSDSSGTEAQGSADDSGGGAPAGSDGDGEATDLEPDVVDGEPDVVDGELDWFFRGAVPDDAGDLVGPLEEVQFDAYGRARIVLENLDVAPVFADAMDAIAEHWLSR